MFAWIIHNTNGCAFFKITFTLYWMVQKASELEANIVSVERVKEYSDIATEAEWILPDNRPPDNWPSEGMVQITGFDFRYREGLPLVLKDINCTIQLGEKICGGTDIVSWGQIEWLCNLVQWTMTDWLHFLPPYELFHQCHHSVSLTVFFISICPLY